MSFATGQRVHFKGDPEKEVYVVDFVNEDSVDLTTPHGCEWEYVPNHLLEPIPITVVVGDIYREKATGTLRFVTQEVEDRVMGKCFWVVSSDVPTNGARYYPKELQDTNLYELVYSPEGLDR